MSSRRGEATGALDGAPASLIQRFQLETPHVTGCQKTSRSVKCELWEVTGIASGIEGFGVQRRGRAVGFALGLVWWMARLEPFAGPSPRFPATARA